MEITWGAYRNLVILTLELHGSHGGGHTRITWHSCGSHTEFKMSHTVVTWVSCVGSMLVSW